MGGAPAWKNENFPLAEPATKISWWSLNWFGPTEALGSGIGGKKPAGRNFSTTQLGVGGTRYWGELPETSRGTCDPLTKAVLYHQCFHPGKSIFLTHCALLTGTRNGVHARASLSSWSGQRARHVLAARPPESPQRAKPIERHRYTNDMVMAKGESLDMTSRNSPVVQDTEPKRQILILVVNSR